MTEMTQTLGLTRAAMAMAMALAVSLPAAAQTARERFASALQRDEQVRVLLTNSDAALAQLWTWPPRGFIPRASGPIWP